MSVLYRIINPVVKGILRSGLHRLLSHNTMLVSYVGKRTGKRFCLPISYAELDGVVIGFTGRDRRWWRNFAGGGDATLLIAGKSHRVGVDVTPGDQHNVEALLSRFLAAVPRDAGFAGVGMVNGTPDSADVAAAAKRLVALRFNLNNAPK